MAEGRSHVLPLPPERPRHSLVKPGDWIVLWVCIACVGVVLTIWAAYLITHP